MICSCYYFVLFCLSDPLRNRHIDFSRSCSYTTKLSSPVLLAFQLPIEKATAAFNQVFQTFRQVKTHELVTLSGFIRYISTKKNS